MRVSDARVSCLHLNLAAGSWFLFRPHCSERGSERARNSVGFCFGEFHTHTYDCRTLARGGRANGDFHPAPATVTDATQVEICPHRDQSERENPAARRRRYYFGRSAGQLRSLAPHFEFSFAARIHRHHGREASAARLFAHPSFCAGERRHGRRDSTTPLRRVCSSHAGGPAVYGHPHLQAEPSEPRPTLDRHRRLRHRVGPTHNTKTMPEKSRVLEIPIPFDVFLQISGTVFMKMTFTGSLRAVGTH